MKKISLTTMILLALVLGMIIGVVLNNTASPETAKLYAQEISIFTTIFLRLIKMIIAPLVVSTLVVGIAKMGDAKALGRIFSKTLFLFICASDNDSNLLIVFYVQIMPDDFVMQLHR
ncbi:cation:dicarboxylase symporter family transporter, partial [Escherichia coli]